MTLSHVRQNAAVRGRQAYLVSNDAMRMVLAVDGAYNKRDVRRGSEAVVHYRSLKRNLGLGTSPAEEKIFGLAQDTFTVSGLVLSAMALPKMMQKTATSFQELKALVHAPTATLDQRLDKAEELNRAAAGTVFSAQGVVLGTKGTIGILARNRGVARVVSSVSDSRAFGFISGPVGKVLTVLLPIADFANFGADVIAARRAFSDPNADGYTKLRKGLNLGLSGLKVSFWLMPQVKTLRSLYQVASTVQLGLMFRDFSEELKPAVVNGVKWLANAVLHPVQTSKEVGTAIKNGAVSVAGATFKTVGFLASKILHPVETWNNLMLWKDAFRGSRTAQPAPAPAFAPSTTGLAPAPALAPAPTAPAPAPVTTSVTGVPVTPAPSPAPMPYAAPAAPYAPAAPTDALYQSAMDQLDQLAAPSY